MTRRIVQTSTFVSALFLLGGCSQLQGDRAEREQRGFVFYCDGSGGGSVLKNYSTGIKKGLLDAGYEGSGEMFPWNTGLGVTADHTSSESYKRGKARQLASQIAEYESKHPGAPVTLMGLSAGTAVAVFALEELPRGVDVENVILLSPSIGADYDLGRALRHVKGKMYVFTSTKDAVLTYLVRNVGTADRRESEPAGIYGFRRPRSASRDAMSDYAKVVHIQWRQEFARYGDLGGHTDVVNAAFVQKFIAPLVMTAPSREEAPAGVRLVRNPDYDRWANLGPGSWVLWQGHQTINGQREAIKLKATLIEKDASTLIVERRYYAAGDEDCSPFRVQTFIEKARIEPSESPLTDPRTKTTSLPARTFTINGRSVRCPGQELVAPGQFDDWGRDLRAKAYGSEEVPGFWASARLAGMKGDERFEYEGEVVAYEAKR